MMCALATGCSRRKANTYLKPAILCPGSRHCTSRLDRPACLALDGGKQQQLPDIAGGVGRLTTAARRRCCWSSLGNDNDGSALLLWQFRVPRPGGEGVT